MSKGLLKNLGFSQQTKKDLNRSSSVAYLLQFKLHYLTINLLF